MTALTIEEAQSNLSETIRQLGPDEEFTITDRGRELALMSANPTDSKSRMAFRADRKMIGIASD